MERCGKINSVNSVAESCTGIGVVVGFLTGAGMMESPYLQMTVFVSIRRYLQTLQPVRPIGKTRNHLKGCHRGKGSRHSGHAKAGRAAVGCHNERGVGMRKGCFIRRSWTAGCAERCLSGVGESWNETYCREAARRFLRLTSR